MNLHWFDVTLDTPMRDIGWVWVVMLAALLFVAWAIRELWRNW
jgi:hypothetical protein